MSLDVHDMEGMIGIEEKIIDVVTILDEMIDDETTIDNVVMRAEEKTVTIEDQDVTMTTMRATKTIMTVEGEEETTTAEETTPMIAESKTIVWRRAP